MKHAIIAFSLVGTFIFSPPNAESVSLTIPDVDVEHLTNGDCSHDTGTLVCNFTDKKTMEDWIDTYPEALHEQLKQAEIAAGKPQAILRKVCSDEGFIGDECPSTLYGMAMQESRMGLYMVGDEGRSRGYFHILNIHNLSEKCKYDLACSAKWSLERMIRYGYGTDPDRAIMAHNGTPGIPATVYYLAAVKTFSKLFSQLK